MNIRFIVIGVHIFGASGPQVRILSIDASSQEAAIDIAEGLGNERGTSDAWTDESFLEFASELSGDRADFVEAEEEAR